MDKVIVMSVATELIKAVMKHGLTIEEAAAKAQMSPVLMGRLIQNDRIITPKTAGKLMAAFGDGVIRICRKNEINFR